MQFYHYWHFLFFLGLFFHLVIKNITTITQIPFTFFATSLLNLAHLSIHCFRWQSSHTRALNTVWVFLVCPILLYSGRVTNWPGIATHVKIVSSNFWSVIQNTIMTRQRIYLSIMIINNFHIKIRFFVVVFFHIVFKESLKQFDTIKLVRFLGGWG